MPRQYTPRRSPSVKRNPPLVAAKRFAERASLLLDWPSSPDDGEHLRRRKARACLGSDCVGGRERERLREPGSEVARRGGDRAPRLSSQLRCPEPGPAADPHYRDGRAQHREPVLARGRPRRRGRRASPRLRAPAREQRRRSGEGSAGPPPFSREACGRHSPHEIMRPAAGGPSHPAQDLARSCRTVDASRHRPAIGCGHRRRGRRCVRGGRTPAPSRLHADWHAERAEREHVAPPVRGLPAGLEGVAAPGRSQPGRRERFPGGGGLRERNHAAAPPAGCRVRRKLSDGGRVHAGAAAVSDPLPRGHRARDVRRSPLAGWIRAAVDDDQSSQVRDRPPRRGAAGRSNRAGGRRETAAA